VAAPGTSVTVAITCGTGATSATLCGTTLGLSEHIPMGQAYGRWTTRDYELDGSASARAAC
jgi:hypothetical protein